jgi:hypothetical protein
MEFEYLPGLVETVHDGKLPTRQGWREALAEMDRAVEFLEAEMAEVAVQTGKDRFEVSSLAHRRKDLEQRLRTAERKRELIEGALAAGLVSDPLGTDDSRAAAERSTGGQD